MSVWSTPLPEDYGKQVLPCLVTIMSEGEDPQEDRELGLKGSLRNLMGKKKEVS